MTIELLQTEEGERIEYKGRRSYEARSIVVGREWQVFEDGVHIGDVRYDMLTRERKTPGKAYVDARWSSPGWQYRSLAPTRRITGWFEPLPSTKAECVRQLQRQAKLRL